MKYVNRYGLPDVFVRAVVNDPYDKGASDFSATGLAAPPLATYVMANFKDKVEVDVTSRVAAIIGQGAHSIAERAARPGVDLCEERLFAKFDIDGITYTVSAQVDLFETDSKILYDWKSTKAYAFSKKAGSGKKPEWISQLNVAAEILRRSGHEVKGLQIIAMLKDWKDAEAGRNGMPESEVTAVELPLWPSEKVVEYITERIRLHRNALLSPPVCNENWAGRRCSKWCDASSACPQYQEALKSGLINKKAEGE